MIMVISHLCKDEIFLRIFRFLNLVREGKMLFWYVAKMTYSLVVTTIHYNTFKITTIIT
jgi:hypothetical protein